jgi:deoxyribodipyrimidine photo-lyase
MSVLHWFRRDLRLTDNTALNAALATGGEVVPVYIVSDWKSAHRWTGPLRQQFLCGCLDSLARNIGSAGGRLIIRQGDAERELERLLVETQADALYFNRDPDLFGRAMEVRVEKMAAKLGCKVVPCKDVAIHERDEVLTGAGQPFRVFTPYARAWMKLEKSAPGKRATKLSAPSNLATLPLPTLETWGLPAAEAPATAHTPASGERAARARLAAFLDGPIFSYAERRDIPAARNTSRLSQDLRFGLLSPREVFAKCLVLAEKCGANERRGVQTFINELIWREFYMQILWHWPEVLEYEFNEKWRGLRWRAADAAFSCWREGCTGFPIVDAGMRELVATGFMHNRVRMITAMFLTKDLHIDWRHGERHFMQCLVDGDIAANNGGWQWSAGTGADAAPYFRIQNPWSQTRRYDPQGEYIKTWVPELRDTPPQKFLEPPSDGASIASGYPAPIVDHATERDVCLEMFRAE